MIQGSVTIVEDTDAVPQFRIVLYSKTFRKVRGILRADSVGSYLGRRKQIEGLLISRVCPLQVITH